MDPMDMPRLAAAIAFALMSMLAPAAKGDGPAPQARLTIADNGQPLTNQPVTVFAPGAGLAATGTTDAKGQLRAPLALPPVPNSPLALAYADGQRQQIDLPRDGSALLVASDRRGGIVALSPAEAAKLAESARPLRVGSNSAVGSGARVAQKATETAGSMLGGMLGGRLGGGLLGGGGGGPSSAASGKPNTATDPIPRNAKRRFADPATGAEIEVGAQMTPKGLLVSATVAKSADDGTFQSLYLQDAEGRRAGPLEYYVYSLYQDWTLTVNWTYDRWVDGQHVEHRQGGWSESGTNMLGTFLVPAEGDGIWRRLGFSNGVRGIQAIGVLFPVTAERIAKEPLHLVAHVTRPSLDPVVTTPFVLSLATLTSPAQAVVLLNTTPLLEGLPPASNAPTKDASGKEAKSGTPPSAPAAAPQTTERPGGTAPGPSGGTKPDEGQPKNPGTTERDKPPAGGNQVATVAGGEDVAAGSTTKVTPAGSVCGPDITSKVLDVLDRMAADFRAAPQATRQQACDALYGFSSYGGAWDIQPLDPGVAVQPDESALMQSYPHWFERYGWPSGCCQPRVPCGWTAQFMGHCIHAQQVNYVQWGALNKLCGTEDQGRIAILARGNVRFWNRTPEEIVAMQMLMSEVGAQYTQRSSIPTVFEGAPVPMQASQRTVDPAAGLDRKGFFSLAQPIVDLASWAFKTPEAGCATTCNLVEPRKSEFQAFQFNYHWDVLHPNRPGVSNAR